MPALRFSNFEGAWKKRKLGELGTFKSGVGFPEAEQGGTSGIPFYKVSDMNLPGNEAVMTTANNYVTDEQVSRLKLKPISARAIIFAKVGAAIFLERKRQAKDFLLDNNMMAFIPGDDVAQEYLSHLFSVLRLSRFAQVGALPSYNGSDLATIKLSLPSIHEQRKIAGFLGSVDTKIAQLAEKKRLLEDYKKGCTQRLFSQKTRFRDDAGDSFPEWEEKRLGEVFSWINTNSLSRERLTYGGGHVQNIHYGDIHTKFAANFHQEAEPVPYIKDATPADFKPEQFCKVGDIVIADASEDYADIGKAIEIVSLSETPLVAGLHTYIARPKPGMVQTGFAGYLLRSAPMRRQIERIAQGISVLGISKGNLEKLTFFLPHPDEQRKIADFLSSLDRKIDLVGQELNHARSFKQGLLQQMFV